jgi:hypothetical protein
MTGSSAETAEGIPDFRLNEAAGRDAALVFSRKSGKPLGEPLSGFSQGLSPGVPVEQPEPDRHPG